MDRSHLIIVLNIFITLLVYDRYTETVYVDIFNLKCKSRNPDKGVFDNCRLEKYANFTIVDINYRLFELPTNRIFVRAQLFRKTAHSKYEPYFFDIRINWCEYLENRNNMLLENLLTPAKNTSNYFEKCPFTGSHRYINISIPGEGIYIPVGIGVGQYRIDVTIVINLAGHAGVTANLEVH